MEKEEENNLDISFKENIINNKEKNYIIAEINIDENNIKTNIRLIN